MITEINNYIKTWEQRCYPDGIPDEAPKEIDDKVPSYRKIAIAILKNDVSIIGVSLPKSEWYGVYKRIELKQRHDNAKKI